MGDTERREALRCVVARFDDVTEDGHGAWSQICENCYSTLSISSIAGFQIDDHGFGICGVEGCDNEDALYLNFNFPVLVTGSRATLDNGGEQ